MARLKNWTTAVVRNRDQLAAIPTDIDPVLDSLTGIRAVVFDVYGTLVISGSGDVGSADNERQVSDHVADSIESVGIKIESMPTAADLSQQIRRLNDNLRSEYCPQPEVDIVEAWRMLLRQRGADVSTAQAVRVAAEYESKANPTWPMPGAAELIAALRQIGFSLGIVSNAQIFTIPLVEELLVDRSLPDGGFDLDLCLFSNRFRQAKPGPRLFDVLTASLIRRGIEPAEAIYVGNDMLNDVWAASRHGLKTAWFAGDVRSCRRRDTDDRCRSLQPDVVLTELMQLPECLGLQ